MTLTPAAPFAKFGVARITELSDNHLARAYFILAALILGRGFSILPPEGLSA
jgi:hypothetical protein